jgi:hypothetical protein
MQTYGELDVLLHAFSTSTLEGDEWSASRPGHFTPLEITPVPTAYGAGWAPEPSRVLWKRKYRALPVLELRSSSP